MNRPLLAVMAAAVLAGCAQAPLTPVPAVPSASAFKEAQGPWVTAQADAVVMPTAWWTSYQDSELNALEQRLVNNSPDLASALARYQQARAATDVVRAAQSPTLDASVDAQRDRQSARRPLRSATSQNNYNSGTLGLDLQYEVDLWGRVRQQVNAGEADERAARADLGAARLALQAQLADTFIALRGADQQLALLQDTIAAYTRSVEVIDRRYQGGIASGIDQARAEAQLASTRSELRQLQAQRAVFEHAIAALVGANASTFAIAAAAVPAVTPVIPLGLPSTLLQRRPDIVAAQMRVAAAGARVGAAKTAFFPALMLGASGGVQSSDLDKIAQASNLFWAVGPSLALRLFDGGRRKAEVKSAEAVLEESAQNYRAVVLDAFGQVEDQLSMLARYGEAAQDDNAAAEASQRALNLATIRYRQGAASYLEVVTAQTAHLQAQRSALDLASRQRRATVQLVRALGGGWSESTT